MSFNDNSIIPTIYDLEIYEDSFDDAKMVYSCRSLTPFTCLAVGNYVDYMSDDHWESAEEVKAEKYVIKEIQHLFYPVYPTHDIQKIMLLVKKERY